MIEKIPGVGGVKQQKQRNNYNSKKKIVYENSSYHQPPQQPTNIKTISTGKVVIAAAAIQNSVQKNSNFNRKRNFAEIRQIKRGYRHLLGRCSESTDLKQKQKTTKKKNSGGQDENHSKKKQRRNMLISISSWDSIEEQINLLEKFINYHYYVKSEENVTDSEENSENSLFENYSDFEVEVEGEGEDTMRRGHQHHPRFSGQRQSNVAIEDVLAALNRPLSDSGGVEAVTVDITSESSSNSSSFYMDKSLDEHSLSSKILDLNKNESDILDQEVNKVHIEDTKKTKKSSKSSKKKTRTEKPVKKSKAGLQTTVIPEDDLETEELAKLRCTSERTELVAERENRRHDNRCSDYPGLDFGGSIFSSDTMMKFNIIRNELHNIMKSQLKRAESEVVALSGRIQVLEEHLERSEEHLGSTSAKLSEASAAADESERAREILENRALSDEDRMDALEKQLNEVRLLVEEADKKFSEAQTTRIT